MHAGCREICDSVDDELSLVALIERRVELDRVAGVAFGPEILAEAFAVIGNDSVRGVENRARGAVVLLEAYDERIREIALKTL